MRHFAGPIQPVTEQQSAELSIGDDRSITYTQGRLEVNLRPLTDEILNRQLAAHSPDKSSFYLNPYEMELNPYTYSDWNPPEQSWTPSRFTVFSLKVKNYEFPKVWLNPEKISLTAANGRQYQALSLAAMVEYYWPYAVGYGGKRLFEDRRAEGHPPGDHVQDRRVRLQRPGIHWPHRVSALAQRRVLLCGGDRRVWPCASTSATNPWKP